MKIGIIGLGLIGGSVALALRDANLASRILGSELTDEIGQRALDLKLVDEILSVEKLIASSDVIVLATPVNHLLRFLPQVMDQVDQQIVMDVGSTKHPMIEAIKDHPKRKQFVACHPMAGTEYSGPEAAIQNLFKGKKCVICDREESDAKAVEIVESLWNKMGMSLLYMQSAEHDLHAAYVSHISHISSFALALTVLETETDEDKMFELAGGGFSSTVRLAKSSPDTWTPIFEQNRDNLLDVVDEHINSLSQFRTLLIKKNFDGIHDLIRQANKIKKILK